MKTLPARSTRPAFIAFLLAIIAAASPLRAAPDLTIGEPVMFAYKNAPQKAPSFAATPKLQRTSSVSHIKTCAYAIVACSIDEKGVCNYKYVNSAHDDFKELLPKKNESLKFTPAERNGQPAAASAYFPIIYNPSSASIDAQKATARLLAVAPLFPLKNERAKLSENLLRKPIWAVAQIDATGNLTSYALEKEYAYADVLKDSIANALKKWRFAPARSDGMPVAGELRIPLISVWSVPAAPNAKDPTATPPQSIKREEPIYPRAMKRSGLIGQVTVQFTIDKKGNVKDPVVTSSNNEGFNQAAIDAVLKWKFKPGIKNGEPVDTRMQLPMTFTLSSGGEEQGQDKYTIPVASAEKQSKLPENLRYDVAPRVIKMVKAVYPYALLSERVKGKAKVVILLNEKGRPVDVEVIETDKPEFGDSAIAAASALTFEPAMNENRPTQSIFTMEFEFNRGSDAIPGRSLTLLSLVQKKSDRIVPANKLDAMPKPTYRAAPVIPPMLPSEKRNGKATIEFLIDTDGAVHLPRAHSADEPLLGYAAVQAVSAWRFEPPLQNGKPVITRVRVPVDFTSK